MKKFRVFWILKQYGYSDIEANTKTGAMRFAEEHPPKDFGDPKQFTPTYQGDEFDGWTIEYIEEVI